MQFSTANGRLRYRHTDPGFRMVAGVSMWGFVLEAIELVLVLATSLLFVGVFLWALSLALGDVQAVLRVLRWIHSRRI